MASRDGCGPTADGFRPTADGFRPTADGFWLSVPETMKANTVIGGLASAQTYYFRFRALTRSGPRDYSQVVSLLVH